MWANFSGPIRISLHLTRQNLGNGNMEVEGGGEGQTKVSESSNVVCIIIITKKILFLKTLLLLRKVLL